MQAYFTQLSVMKAFRNLFLLVAALGLVSVTGTLLLVPGVLIPSKCGFDVPARLRWALTLGADPAQSVSGQKLFRHAACLGNVELVRLLIQHGMKPQDIRMYNENETLLSEVIRKSGSDEMVRLLVEHGAPLPPLVGMNAPDWEKLSPELTDYLLSSGMQPDTEHFYANSLMQCYEGREQELAAKIPPSARPLLFVQAVLHNRVPLVKALLQQGVSVSALDERAGGIIHAGCGETQEDITELIRVLQEAGFSLHKEYDEGKTLLEMAFDCAHTDVYRVLKAAGADDAALRRKLGDLPYLSVLGSAEEAQAAIPAASPEQREQALIKALRANRADVAAALLDAGVSAEKVEWDDAAFDAALLRRVMAGQTGEHPNRRSELARAFGRADAALYPELLAAYGDINSPPTAESACESLLERALWADHTPLVRFLLQNGAKITAGAVFCVYSEKCLDALLEAGLDINMRSEDGDTLLIRAVRNGDAEDIAILLKRGADVNARDRYGNTPLHEAVECGDAALVRLLLEAGADTTARNETGLTPAEMAMEFSYGSVLRVLLNKNL